MPKGVYKRTYGKKYQKKRSDFGSKRPWTGLKISLAKKGVKQPKLLGNKHCGVGKDNHWFGKFGKNHPSWKEVKKDSFNSVIRRCSKYIQWRSDVFERDNYTCRLCGARGVYLEADHYPKRFSKILIENKIQTYEQALECVELWDINNGRTLCRPCHNPTRGRYEKILA